jgi:chromatin remodeling complex protein RSC6
MSKNNKKTSTPASPAPVIMTPAPAPAPVVVAAVAPVVVAESKPKRTKTAAAAAAPAIKEEIVAAPAPVVAAEAAEGVEDAALNEKSIEFLAKLNQIGTLISSLKTEYRSLEKAWSKNLKAAQKLSSKRKRKAGTRAPSGFVKPTKISDELAAFLGREKGTEMARTDVTRAINGYIRTNALQDKDNGRKINPDAKLASLLKLKKEDELTYFNLQKYMGIHFAKAAAPTATA